jgi:uncharacterized protein (TIGR00255 family)
MRSMTGFGIADVPHGAGRVLAEIRSVNGRFLDVRARLPRDLSDLTLFAEHVVRRRVRRGRIELSVTTEGQVTGPVAIDVPRARAAMAALIDLARELAPNEPAPLSLLSAVPDLFTPGSGSSAQSLRAAVERAIELATTALLEMCESEGAKLAADLRQRAEAIRVAHEHAAARAELLPGEALARLGARVRKITEAHRVEVHQERLESELVLLAERCDFAEETTRLRAHIEHFVEILDAPPSIGDDESAAPVGRRLDFVLQEMGREINTLGAKAQDAAISRDVVAMKVELERMREQVQNVE